jgi:tRNA (cytidine/uridine-2'-O-)-methyltransferase
MHIVLYEPEIPQNTGNIIRLCANVGAALHLIEPLGFEWDDKRLRRAGLDYHEFAQVTRHADLAACQRQLSEQRWLALTTKAQNNYAEIQYQSDDVFLFGPETRGLPDDLLNAWPPDHKLRVPMQESSRSLNLSNTVAIVVFEAWRQHGFSGRR